MLALHVNIQQFTAIYQICDIDNTCCIAMIILQYCPNTTSSTHYSRCYNGKCRSRHTVVCRVAKFGCVRQCVLFTRTNFKPFSAIYNTKTTGSILIKIMSQMPYSLVTQHIKFERNRPSSSRDTWFQKLPKFLHIFLLRNTP